MTKIKLLTVSVIGLLVLNLFSLGLHFYEKPAKPERQDLPKPPKGGPRAIIIEQLHFDSLQIKAYDQLIVEHKKSINENDKLLSDLKTKLYQTLVSIDSTEKKSLNEQIAVIQKKIEDIHYVHFLAIKKLCKAEQLSAYNELTKEFAVFFNPQRRQRPPNENGRREPPPEGEGERGGPPPPREDETSPPPNNETDKNISSPPKENK